MTNKTQAELDKEAADAYAQGIGMTTYNETEISIESFLAGAKYARTINEAARATGRVLDQDSKTERTQLEHMKELCIKTEEDYRFYHREWEYSCERHSYTREELKYERERISAYILKIQRHLDHIGSRIEKILLEITHP